MTTLIGKASTLRKYASMGASRSLLIGTRTAR